MWTVSSKRASQTRIKGVLLGYIVIIVMLRARMFRSLIIRTGTKNETFVRVT